MGMRCMSNSATLAAKQAATVHLISQDYFLKKRKNRHFMIGPNQRCMRS